ncbi:outer membrane protein assembly factor BamC [Methylovulum miyakonense]|uniref:outer membrane protein assembly factor BamC n=1 Tax=Methylovulum miyakonense TaxID=645578 RepID=UPI0003829741|nr:outer membrane protein assembly factor BamC [Methylovulum miyakonense]
MKIVRSFLLALALTACGGDDPRYRNTEMLERPPVLVTHASPTDAAILEDDSVITKKKHKKGLEDDVYLTASKPPAINIKQTFGEAWNTLKLALTQSEIKITDEEKDKGLYFVSYNPKSLFGVVNSLLSKEEKQVIYVLTVEPNGQETRVSIKKASASEQSSSLESNNIDREADDDAEALLYQLFETLRDDLLTV